MLNCCNSNYYGSFSYVVFNSAYFYHRIEFGICPECGCVKFFDYRQYADGSEKVKVLSGKAATKELERWRRKIATIKHGTRSNQNIYYGDFRKTNRLDEKGNIIYLQLRKNFNNQTEILGEVKTLVYV